MMNFWTPMLIRHPDNVIIECFSDMETGKKHGIKL